MCRHDDYPPFDGPEVGAMLRAAQLDDVLYDPHEDHIESQTWDTLNCPACISAAERDAAERYF